MIAIRPLPAQELVTLSLPTRAISWAASAIDRTSDEHARIIQQYCDGLVTRRAAE